MPQAAVTAGFWAEFWVTVGTQIAVAYVSRELARSKARNHRGDTGSAARPNDDRLDTHYWHLAPRRFALGESRMGGIISWRHVKGDLYLRIDFCHHQIERFGSIWLDDKEIRPEDINSAGDVVNSVFAGKLYIGRHLGADDQAADARFVENLGTVYDETCRGAGIAYLALILKRDDKLYSSGVPNVQAMVRGAMIWDPRTNTTGWSNNAALCAAWYLTHELGMNRPWSSIDMPALITAANICDERVPVTLDGSITEARYTADGLGQTKSVHRDTLSKILSAMGGTLVWVRGTWQIFAAAYVQPVRDVSAEDLIDGLSITYDVSTEARVNTVSGIFMTPANRYEDSQTPALQHQGYIAADGGRRFAEYQLPWTVGNLRAQRLVMLALRTSRAGRVITAKLTARHYGLSPNDRVTFYLSELGIAEIYRVESVSINWSSWPEYPAVEVVLRQDIPEIYNWDITQDAQITIPLGGNPETTEVPDPPQNLAIRVLRGGHQITWVPPDDGFYAATRLYISKTPNFADATVFKEIAKPGSSTTNHISHTELRWYWASTLSIVGVESEITPSTTLPGVAAKSGPMTRSATVHSSPNLARNGFEIPNGPEDRRPKYWSVVGGGDGYEWLPEPPTGYPAESVSRGRIGQLPAPCVLTQIISAADSSVDEHSASITCGQWFENTQARLRFRAPDDGRILGERNISTGQTTLEGVVIPSEYAEFILEIAVLSGGPLYLDQIQVNQGDDAWSFTMHPLDVLEILSAEWSAGLSDIIGTQFDLYRLLTGSPENAVLAVMRQQVIAAAGEFGDRGGLIGFLRVIPGLLTLLVSATNTNGEIDWDNGTITGASRIDAAEASLSLHSEILEGNGLSSSTNITNQVVSIEGQLEYVEGALQTTATRVQAAEAKITSTATLLNGARADINLNTQTIDALESGAIETEASLQLLSSTVGNIGSRVVLSASYGSGNVTSLSSMNLAAGPGGSSLTLNADLINARTKTLFVGPSGEVKIGGTWAGMFSQQGSRQALITPGHYYVIDSSDGNNRATLGTSSLKFSDPWDTFEAGTNGLTWLNPTTVAGAYPGGFYVDTANPLPNGDLRMCWRPPSGYNGYQAPGTGVFEAKVGSDGLLRLAVPAGGAPAGTYTCRLEDSTTECVGDVSGGWVTFDVVTFNSLSSGSSVRFIIDLNGQRLAYGEALIGAESAGLTLPEKSWERAVDV